MKTIDQVAHLLIVTEEGYAKSFELEHPGCSTETVELDSISGDREAAPTFERHTCRMQHVVDWNGLEFLEHQDGEARGWQALEPGFYQVVSYSDADDIGAVILAPLPVSDQITMRPVWRRRQCRQYLQSPLGEPSEREIQDAIRVLEDAENQTFAPALYLEAFTIFDEASR